MKRLLAEERETIFRWDGTRNAAVIGSDIPSDVAKLTKLWGPAPDIQGDWHSWPNIPKGAAKLPRPHKPSAARIAAGKRLAKSRQDIAKTTPKGKVDTRDNTQ